MDIFERNQFRYQTERDLAQHRDYLHVELYVNRDDEHRKVTIERHELLNQDCMYTAEQSVAK